MKLFSGKVALAFLLPCALAGFTGCEMPSDDAATPAAGTTTDTGMTGTTGTTGTDSGGASVNVE